MLAEAKLMEPPTDVVRYFVKLRLCNVVTKLASLCRNVATTSLLNVATKLSTDVDETFISNELTISIQSVVRSCDNVVTTALCLLGW